jgi:membrane protease YdiL (CAAX protease family)
MELPEGPSRFAGASLNLAAWRIAGGYALLASLATALVLGLRGGLPWEHPAPWLELPLASALGLSAGLGLGLGLLLVVLTRFAVPRFGWARRLHLELRPVARDLTLGRILVVAAFSSLGEELLFRGMLQPWIGLVPAALVFGIVHQIPGPSRWVWVGWATTVGLGLGAIFALSGSLVGPLVAHAVVNGLNLGFLRDYDPAPPRRALPPDPVANDRASGAAGR